MPIDARIPLMVQPAQIDSPMEMAGNFLKLKELREVSMARMRDRQEDEQIRSIFQQSQGDMDGALSRIRQINPLKAASIEETWTKSRKATAELEKLDLERTGKLQELLSQELGNVTDQSSWDHYRAYATAVRHSANLPPPALEETYSPEKVEQYKLNGMALKDQLAAKHQELVDKETGRHNLATEGLTASGQAITAENTAADNARAAEAAAETARHNRATEGTARATEARLAKAAKEGGTGNGGLVDTVIANPSLWDDLTPTVKGQIAPLLREKGFEGFGKPLSEKATGQIADTRSAIDNLKELLEIMKKNEQYIGPLGGLQALNPYSEARKVQGDIARVRQRAGKRLEGGVLRKEDEIKYKEILGTILDAPDTAIYKTEGLINTLENDIKNYVNQQRLAGRRVTTQTGSSLPTERTTTGPQVGQTVTVRGKKVKITKVLSNGQFEGVAAQ